MTTSIQRIPASTVLGLSADILQLAGCWFDTKHISRSPAYSLSIKLKDHKATACKRVLDTLAYLGFRILRQTKRGGVITVHVRYCASDMAEALGELAKIVPVDPAIKAELFILS